MITQVEPIAVVFTLPEDALRTVLPRIRARARLPVDAFDRSGATRLASGSVVTVDNQIDQSTGTVRVKAVFENRDHALFPAQFVNVQLLAEQRAQLVVPAAAVQQGPQGPFVYIVRKGEAAVRPVTVGATRVSAPLSSMDSTLATSSSPTASIGCAREGRGGSRVSLSRPFILRPVATSLLMVRPWRADVAYQQLPVSALPEVDYPTIQVTTFYPGASPDVMATSVTAPLERQFGQMPGLKQMTSTSSFGSSVITLQFDLALNIDIAEQEVQAAVNASGTLLPSDLPNPPVYSKVNPADAPVLTLALTSERVTAARGAVAGRYATGSEDLTASRRRLGHHQRRTETSRPGASQSNGVSGVRLGLAQPQAIAAANANQAKGAFDGPQRAYTIDANDQLLRRRVPVAGRGLQGWRAGAPLGCRRRRRRCRGHSPGGLGQHDSGGHREHPAPAVRQHDRRGRSDQGAAAQLSDTLPPAVHVSVLTDRTTTIRASVADVQFELVLTVALVVAVIFLFLRKLSTTLIPAVAVPLSLVGTFAAMYFAGFSLNNLTLMALTISTGFVVDDAIVMIENITRYVEAGEPPLQAALKGAEQIGFTIVSLTVSLIAVLIPLLFMSDIVGRLFGSLPSR